MLLKFHTTGVGSCIGDCIGAGSDEPNMRPAGGAASRCRCGEVGLTSDEGFEGGRPFIRCGLGVRCRSGGGDRRDFREVIRVKLEMSS